MSTTFISMGLATTAVVGVVVVLGLSNLLIGAFSEFIERPKIVFLKSKLGQRGFAFFYSWNNAKDPVTFDVFRLRLFNPFGHPTQREISRPIPHSAQDFYGDLDLGSEFLLFLQALGLEDALVEIELSSSQEGFSQRFQFKGHQFLEKIAQSQKTIEEHQQKVQKEGAEKIATSSSFGVIARDNVAAPFSEDSLKLPTNPHFAAEFAGAGHAPSGDQATGDGEKGQSAAANFSVTKVWIAPGCIVCNACEDIYPEVFDVQTDTCVIKPNPPLDNGLRIQEAAEACPVEVIKFTKAS